MFDIFSKRLRKLLSPTEVKTFDQLTYEEILEKIEKTKESINQILSNKGVN